MIFVVANRSTKYPRKLPGRKLYSFVLTKNIFYILDNKRTKLFNVLGFWTKIGLIYWTRIFIRYLGGLSCAGIKDIDTMYNSYDLNDADKINTMCVHVNSC